jgi:two-component system, chemotaxis family, chemotaxis protein CheY
MGKNILVVDDSASMRQVVKLTLTGAGYSVVEACDGLDALAKANGEKFHLIISDVNMPNMGGLSFLLEVKKRPAYKFTPVLMLTTEVSEDKKAAGREAGAKAWIVKPFQPAHLLAAVGKLVI